MLYTLPDMNCGHCRRSVEAAIRDADPRAEVAVDLPARTVSVRSNRGGAEIADALRAAGYPPAA